MSWRGYEEGLLQRVTELHGRLHKGTFRATPSRRVYIPKSDGRQRPLGIASLEDKIVQQAVVTVLNAIYEEDFLGFSYGFRPGRSQHDVLDALTVVRHGRCRTPVGMEGSILVIASNHTRRLLKIALIHSDLDDWAAQVQARSRSLCAEANEHALGMRLLTGVSGRTWVV